MHYKLNIRNFYFKKNLDKTTNINNFWVTPIYIGEGSGSASARPVRLSIARKGAIPETLRLRTRENSILPKSNIDQYNLGRVVPPKFKLDLRGPAGAREFFISCKESRIESNTSFYGCFYLGPFDESLSQTLANDLRRTLLSELTGLAITSVEIEGVLHKFTSLPGMKEPVLDLISNLQTVVLKKNVDQLTPYQYGPVMGRGMPYPTTAGEEPKPLKRAYTAFLKVRGPKIITAGDLKLPVGLQCVDPNQYIATLAEDGLVNARIDINEGKSYIFQKSQNLDVTALKKRNILLYKTKPANMVKDHALALPREGAPGADPQGNLPSIRQVRNPGFVTRSLNSTRSSLTSRPHLSGSAIAETLALDAVFMPVTKVNCIVEDNNLATDINLFKLPPPEPPARGSSRVYGLRSQALFGAQMKRAGGLLRNPHIIFGGPPTGQGAPEKKEITETPKGYSLDSLQLQNNPLANPPEGGGNALVSASALTNDQINCPPGGDPINIGGNGNVKLNPSTNTQIGTGIDGWARVNKSLRKGPYKYVGPAFFRAAPIRHMGVAKQTPGGGPPRKIVGARDDQANIIGTPYGSPPEKDYISDSALQGYSTGHTNMRPVRAQGMAIKMGRLDGDSTSFFLKNALLLYSNNLKLNQLYVKVKNKNKVRALPWSQRTNASAIQRTSHIAMGSRLRGQAAPPRLFSGGVFPQNIMTLTPSGLALAQPSPPPEGGGYKGGQQGPGVARVKLPAVAKRLLYPDQYYSSLEQVIQTPLLKELANLAAQQQGATLSIGAVPEEALSPAPTSINHSTLGRSAHINTRENGPHIDPIYMGGGASTPDQKNVYNSDFWTINYKIGNQIRNSGPNRYGAPDKYGISKRSVGGAYAQNYLTLEYSKLFKLKPMSKKCNLIVEIWTNGSIHPRQALYSAFTFLSNTFLKLKKVKMLGSMFKSELAYANINKYYTTSLAEARLTVSQLQYNTGRPLAPPSVALASQGHGLGHINIGAPGRLPGAQFLGKRASSPNTNLKVEIPVKAAGGSSLEVASKNLGGDPLDSLPFKFKSRTKEGQSIIYKRGTESLQAPVGVLPISLRSYTALRKANILTLGDLIMQTRTDLLKLKNFGPKSLFEVEHHLGNVGLTLPL
jgi:DNA-directed RNA polymerase alpha subunit